MPSNYIHSQLSIHLLHIDAPFIPLSDALGWPPLHDGGLLAVHSALLILIAILVPVVESLIYCCTTPVIVEMMQMGVGWIRSHKAGVRRKIGYYSKSSVKGKTAGRSDSRDVVFSPVAGQSGPPAQMPLHVQSSSIGTAVSGAIRMEIPSSSSALGPQQMQQQVPNQQSMGQIPSSAYSAGMYPSYWPPQQMRYIQPGNVHPGHYYPVQSQGSMPPSAFTGYGMPQGTRQIMAANSTKIQQQPSSQIEMPRLPNGPMPSEWQSRINTPKSLPESLQQTTPGQLLTTSSGMPAPSPGGTSSAADESLEDSKSLPGASPNPWPHTPSQMSQGHRTPVPANRPNTPTVNKRQDPTSIVDRLVGPITAMNPQHIMPERRAFFEKLVQFCEQQGEPITQVPQVSKQTVDLHRLYLAVMKRGGFEQVTRDKTWKQVCTEANSEMSESSAAGYQLRRHYQKYLLGLECLETGKNASEVVAFAERLKKRRKDNKDHNAQQYPGPVFQTRFNRAQFPSGLCSFRDSLRTCDAVLINNT
ncbi:ARID/BRIGHT DNA binding domain protein [Dirofilaria immitis]|nr:ARID/BRIGHT DNA binding domain protein [Dirofilaria immitis]